MEYAFDFGGKVYGPSGAIKSLDGVPLKSEDVRAYNDALEAQELNYLKSGPERVFLYVKTPPDPTNDPRAWYVTTWRGTIVSDARAIVGPSRAFPCFGPFPSKRRSVRAYIFGRLYVGWYFESSGSYCRLRLAKVRA